MVSSQNHRVKLRIIFFIDKNLKVLFMNMQSIVTLDQIFHKFQDSNFRQLLILGYINLQIKEFHVCMDYFRQNTSQLQKLEKNGLLGHLEGVMQQEELLLKNNCSTVK